MGKVTGFLEFERLEEGYEPVGQRLKTWKEFVIGLNTEQAKVQGARCMDCGTPFCNNGDRKSTRLNSSHVSESRMPSSA